MGHILKLVIFLKIKFNGLACNLSGNVNFKAEGKKSHEVHNGSETEPQKVPFSGSERFWM